ncbi:MAG: hypothetical protein AB1486_12740 [Planctomycetota bacterium]
MRTLHIRCRPTLSLLPVVLAVAISLVLSGRARCIASDLPPCTEPWGQAPADSLDDVFVCDGILDDLLHRTLADFDVQPVPDTPPVQEENGVLIVNLRYRGMRFQGYHKDDSSCIREVESRIQVEIRCPLDLDLGTAPLLNLDKGDEDGEGGRSLTIKRALAELMSANGILSAIWLELDEDGAADTVAQMLGYQGDGDIYMYGLDWIMQSADGSSPLTVQQLRFDFRFAYIQGYMLTATFVREWLKACLPAYGYDPAAVAEWLDSLRVLYSGGSKRGAAMAVIGGIDPRTAGVRMKGNQGLEGGAKGMPGRYIFDWGYCPGDSYEDHKWAPFATWVYFNELAPWPNYSDIYVPARDPDRYSHLLFIDAVGTHDWINPLGSHATFWRRYDGLDDNGNPDGSAWWSFRTIRRPNRNHGVVYEVGPLPGTEDDLDPVQVAAQDVLLWWALQSLKDPSRPFPRMEIARAWMPPAFPTSWKARVHIPAFTPEPGSTEELHVWVALSDNRDFRRCDSPPILHLWEGEPCYELDKGDTGGSGGLDSDMYGEIEDVFYRIAPERVTVNGDFRTIHFPRPPEYTQFASPPLVALIVEYTLRGPDDSSPWDDLVLFTEVTYLNEELYPLTSDCVPAAGQ